MKPHDTINEAVEKAMLPNEKSIDELDTEQSHSTAADGGNPQVEEDNPSTTPSTGNLPDADTLSDNEDSETDSERISDK